MSTVIVKNVIVLFECECFISKHFFLNLRNAPLSEETEKSVRAMRKTEPDSKPNEKWESKWANKNYQKYRSKPSLIMTTDLCFYPSKGEKCPDNQNVCKKIRNKNTYLYSNKRQGRIWWGVHYFSSTNALKKEKKIKELHNFSLSG